MSKHYGMVRARKYSGRNSKINYNIGLAYYQLRQWPKAILNQEIALELGAQLRDL
ncbi:MAG: hypothetical protein IPL98_02335 [Saprospiraceae bacterium]|nr:hypothetical protein [Saprospiraceae bacterium]